MPLFRSNVHPLFKITNIIYNDFLNFTIHIQTPYNFQSSSINRNQLQNIELNEIINNTLKHYDNIVFTYLNLFEKMSPKLKEEFKDKVTFTRCMDDMNITKLVRSFDISGKSIFLALTEDTYTSYWDKASADYIKNNTTKKELYFDYVGNYGLKCCLPLDNEHYNIDTVINPRRYIDRSGTTGIERLLTLFESKINNDEIMYADPIKIPNTNTYNPDKPNSLIIPTILPKEIQYFRNHHHNKYDINDDNKPEYLMDSWEDYKTFFDENRRNNNFDLTKYFMYVKRPNYRDFDYTPTIDDYMLTPRNNVSLEHISVASCIMFGNDNIRLKDVEKLLSMIRFDISGYWYSIDNFKVDVFHKHTLKLLDDSKVLDKTEFTQYNNFLAACVWVVQVMNHINPEYIHHHNYKVVCD